MDLDTFTITIFPCIVDDMEIHIKDQKLRQRGPGSLLNDSEVMAMEVAGEYLGLDCDKEIFKYFRSHYTHFFSQTF